MSEQLPPIEVRALAAYTRDVGRNFARIDQTVMKEIQVSYGDAIEILGGRRTVSKCMPLYPSDIGKGLMRIDGLVRDNGGISIGDKVKIRRTVPTQAERITIAPIEEASFTEEEYVREMLSGIPLTLGDKVMMPFGILWITFVVLDIQPVSSASVIGVNTKVELLPSIS